MNNDQRTHPFNASNAVNTEYWEDGVSVEIDGEISFHRNLDDASTQVSEGWIDGASEAKLQCAEGFYAWHVQAGGFDGLQFGPYSTRGEALAAVVKDAGLDLEDAPS